MERRDFAKTIAVLLTPLRVLARRPNYLPFVRGGCLITPHWRWLAKGERTYLLGAYADQDRFLTARVGHWHLATSAEEVGRPDEGKSPRDLGFLETKWAKVQFAPETWERSEGWWD